MILRKFRKRRKAALVFTLAMCRPNRTEVIKMHRFIRHLIENYDDPLMFLLMIGLYFFILSFFYG